MTEDVSFRLLAPEEWAAAVDLSARAFIDEPYVVELFGEERVTRYARVLEHFRAKAWSSDARVIAATCGPVLVGFVSVFPPGHCQLCLDTATATSSAPDDERERMEWQFDRDRSRAHQAQGEHAWIHKVAVEPFLSGQGIGRALVAQALSEARRSGAGCVILECQPHREAFYASCGMTRSSTFPDPVGPDVSVMRVDLVRHPTD